MKREISARLKVLAQAYNGSVPAVLYFPLLFVTEKAILNTAREMLRCELSRDDMLSLKKIVERNQILYNPIWRTLDQEEVFTKLVEFSNKYPPDNVKS